MKMAKKLLAMAVVLAMMLDFTSSVLLATGNVRVVVDGVEVQFEGQGPIMVEGRVFAPARGVFTQMGFDIDWDGAARIAILSNDYFIVEIPADGVHFYVNGEVVVPVVAQFMLNERIMLPVGAIAVAVGATTSWDDDARVATINKTHHALIGTWAWTPMDYDYDIGFVFNADGTGNAFVNGDIVELTWSFSDTYDNTIVLATDDGYYLSIHYVIIDDVLTLADADDPDDSIDLVRQ